MQNVASENGCINFVLFLWAMLKLSVNLHFSIEINFDYFAKSIVACEIESNNGWIVLFKRTELLLVLVLTYSLDQWLTYTRANLKLTRLLVRNQANKTNSNAVLVKSPIEYDFALLTIIAVKLNFSIWVDLRVMVGLKLQIELSFWSVKGC